MEPITIYPTRCEDCKFHFVAAGLYNHKCGYDKGCAPDTLTLKKGCKVEKIIVYEKDT